MAISWTLVGAVLSSLCMGIGAYLKSKNPPADSPRPRPEVSSPPPSAEDEQPWDMSEEEQIRFGEMRAYNRSVDVFNQSLELARNSKNPETRKNNIGVALSVAQMMHEDYPEDEQWPELISLCEAMRREVHTRAVFEAAQKCTERANAVKTVKAKLNAAQKALQILEASSADPFVMQAHVDEWRNAVHEYISRVQCEVLQHKAQGLAARGQDDKALQTYAEAVALLRSDEVDDAAQAELFEALEEKIKAIQRGLIQ